MFYDGYHFGGMHLVWWFFWVFFIFMMFGWYTPVSRRNSHFDILKRRFAAGEITKEEYQEKKKILENDLAK